jgi:hypothetical protein
VEAAWWGALCRRGKRTSPTGLTLCQRTLVPMPDSYVIVAYMSPEQLQARDFISEFSREHRRRTSAEEWSKPLCDPTTGAFPGSRIGRTALRNIHAAPLIGGNSGLPRQLVAIFRAGEGFRCPAVVVQSARTRGAARCVTATSGAGRYPGQASPEHCVRGTCRWRFRSAPTARLPLGGGNRARFIVTGYTVWLGMLISAYGPGGATVAGLVR